MTSALAALIGLGVVAAVARLVVRWVRSPASARFATWRLAVLVLAQPLSGGLLYLALTVASEPMGDTLIVATHGSGRTALLRSGRVVALPEAPPLPGIDRVPDLATAVRRFRPARLQVVGDGLGVRDRDAAVGLALDYTSAGSPRGIVRLTPPRAVVSGGRFSVGGRVGGAGPFSVDLIDPAGRRVATATPDAGGDFVVTGTARIAGAVTFIVRVHSAARIIEEAAVPLWVDPATPQRLLLLAGSPGPEVKYLRRWATDAGLAVHSEVATGAGLVLGDASLPLTVATLARFDIAVMDARRWAGLSSAERSAFAAAVRDGLGLLIRIDEALSEPVRAALRPLGFVVAGGDETVVVTVAGAGDAGTRLALGGPGTRDAPTVADPGSGVPALMAWRLAVTGPATTPLLLDSRAAPVGTWRAVGQGRAGLWPLVDSYRLALAGHGDTYGELWSAALTTLGRSHGPAAPVIDYPSRVGERVTVCGVGPEAQVIAPDGHSTALLIDPAAGRDCAGFWPVTTGWHDVRQAAFANDDHAGFFVSDRTALPNAAALANRMATIALARASNRPAGTGATMSPREPWPWLVAWLLVTTALWWFERRRLSTTH